MFDWTDFCQTAEPVCCCTTHWRCLHSPKGFELTLKESQWKSWYCCKLLCFQMGNATLQLVSRFLLLSVLTEEKPSGFATGLPVVYLTVNVCCSISFKLLLLLCPFSSYLCSSFLSWLVRHSCSLGLHAVPLAYFHTRGCTCISSEPRVPVVVRF